MSSIGRSEDRSDDDEASHRPDSSHPGTLAISVPNGDGIHSGCSRMLLSDHYSRTDDPTSDSELSYEDSESPHYSDSTDSDGSDYFLEDDILYSNDGPVYVVRDYFQPDYGMATRIHPPPYERIIFSIHFTVESCSDDPNNPQDTFHATAIQLTAAFLIGSDGEAIAPVLSSLGVPHGRHRLILEQICETASTMLEDPEHALRLIFSMNVWISDGVAAVGPVVCPDERGAGSTGARESLIGALTRVSRRRCEGQSECSICLEEFELRGELDLMEMSCSHVFHGDCIVRWLRASPTCPLCRYSVPCTEDRSTH